MDVSLTDERIKKILDLEEKIRGKKRLEWGDDDVIRYNHLLEEIPIFLSREEFSEYCMAWRESMEEKISEEAGKRLAEADDEIEKLKKELGEVKENRDYIAQELDGIGGRTSEFLRRIKEGCSPDTYRVFERIARSVYEQ